VKRMSNISNIASLPDSDIIKQTRERETNWCNGLSETLRIRYLFLKYNSNVSVYHPDFNYPNEDYAKELAVKLYDYAHSCYLYEKELYPPLPDWLEHVRKFDRVKESRGMERLLHYMVYMQPTLLSSPQRLAYEAKYLQCWAVKNASDGVEELLHIDPPAACKQLAALPPAEKSPILTPLVQFSVQLDPLAPLPFPSVNSESSSLEKRTYLPSEEQSVDLFPALTASVQKRIPDAPPSPSKRKDTPEPEIPLIRRVKPKLPPAAKLIKPRLDAASLPPPSGAVQDQDNNVSCQIIENVSMFTLRPLPEVVHLDSPEATVNETYGSENEEESRSSDVEALAEYADRSHVFKVKAKFKPSKRASQE